MHISDQKRRALDRPQRSGSSGHQGLPLSRLQRRDTPGTPHVVAWPDTPGLLSQSAVEERRHWHTSCWQRRPLNADAAQHGLSNTQLGSTGPRVVFLHGLFGQGRTGTRSAKQ